MDFPISLKLTGKCVLVVGAGPVGIRKATACHDAGAKVLLVDPNIERVELEGIEFRREPFQSSHLNGMFLAFACASSTVNATVVVEANARNIWVLDATNPERGDFTLSGVVRQGDLTLTVSTGGAAPALAKRIADELGVQFGPEYAEWIELLAEVRTELRATEPNSTIRQDWMRVFSGEEWLKLLRSEGREAVRKAMIAKIRASL